ncbi:hypothetical protein [Enterobacter phage N5822]|nr:hypothetical protein [Enterobacter phage N5822]QPD96255.1 hypothetical protein [Enterobacter phage N5822]
MKIAASTGEIDKRTINGNNGVKRGKDKKKRKRKTGYYVLKDEVKAGLRARLDAVCEYYGSRAEMTRRLKVTHQVIQQWRKRGMISVSGAEKVHADYKRNGCKGYRASFCRPDLRFDSNGKALTTKCDRYEMLRVVKESDFINSTNS